MSSLIIKRCCCICDLYPTSIVINVAAWNNGGGLSFAAFTQTLYKCCIQTQEFPQYWGLKECCVYKMNPVLCGITTNDPPTPRPIYFVMIIKFGNPPNPTLYDQLEFNVRFGSSARNTALGLCVIPRSDYTSATACYGLGVDEFCGIKEFDLQAFADGFFQANDITGCNCTAGAYGNNPRVFLTSSILETYRYVGNCDQVAGTYILDYITPDLTVTIS